MCDEQKREEAEDQNAGGGVDERALSSLANCSLIGLIGSRDDSPQLHSAENVMVAFQLSGSFSGMK